VTRSARLAERADADRPDTDLACGGALMSTTIVLYRPVGPEDNIVGLIEVVAEFHQEGGTTPSS
jgi:hypothetical protein